MIVGETRRSWLTRNMLVLSGVSFLQDAASELLYPVLPIFLTTVLGAPSPWSAWWRVSLRALPHRAAGTAGAVVGPLLGLAGYALFHHRIRPLLLLAVVPAVLSVLVLFSLVNFPDALLLRLHAIGFGVTGVVASYVVYNASYGLLSYPGGALADRWPRHRI
jgi:MFS family permease